MDTGSKDKPGFEQTEIGIVPKDWAVEELDSCVVTIFCGRDPTGGKQSHSKERTAYRIIQSAPVFDGYLDRSKVGYISEKMYCSLKSASVKENDVLLNQLGDGITFARSCIVPFDVLPAIITRSVGCIRCNDKKLDPWFLNSFLVLPKTKNYIESFNSGSSRRAIDGGKMRSFLVPIPPLEEQRKIGLFFKTLQKRIELTQQVNKTLDLIGRAVFKRWFVDFEFPLEEGKPYKSSGGEMVYSEELGKDIPKEWHVGRICDLCFSITNGGTPKRAESEYWNGGIAWFKTGELTDGPLIGSEEHITKEGLKNSACKLWDENTILIALYGFTVGKLGVLKIKAAANQACSGLVAKKEVGYLFLFYSLLFKRQEFINFAVGAAQQNISQQIVQETRTIIPPTALLRDFTTVLSFLFDKQTALILQNRTLTLIRDTLLPKLMSGKIRVPFAKENVEA